MLSRGDVVLTRFPFTDLTSSSLRPALVVSDGAIKDDIVLVAISSVLRDTSSADVLIEASHPEFPETGLRMSSVLRLHKLAAVERSILLRRLGKIGARLQAEVDEGLREVLCL